MNVKLIQENIKKFLAQPLIINIVIVATVTLGVKIIGFYKETVIASSYGLSELIDTFYIALLIPTFIQNVFINALCAIYIPNYIAELKSGGNKGEFQSIIFLTSLAIALFFFILILIFENFFLSTLFPGHSSSYYISIQNQLNYILPCLFFWSLSAVISGLLDISNKFFFSTISSVFLSLSVIVCLLFFTEELGNLTISIGMLIGSILSFIFLLIVSLYYKLIVLKKPKFSKNSKEMIKQLPPKISSGLLSGLNNFVDQFFAAQLVVGSITAINYGIKIPSFIISIIIIALGNVLLPHFSRLINTDLKQAYQQLFKILKTIFILALVIVIISFFFSDEIIRLLFERNEFNSDDTTIVSNIQKITLIYIPFYLCTMVLVRFLTSINKNSFMAWISFFSLIANIVLNIVLIKQYGVYGLVLGTTIIYILTFFFFINFTLKQYKLSKKTI
ncbi:murein biosynthesis integral membrane protein MurJ [Winogradskyella sp. PC D3.3]